MTTWESIQAKWMDMKPQAIALAIGLVVGPFISNALGWQITSGSAQTQTRAGIVEKLASVCDALARGTVENPGKLDWTARIELAKKWAVMPGNAAAETDVTYACERKLQI